MGLVSVECATPLFLINIRQDINIRHMNNRDSFIFYRSFYEAISELPEENQLEIYQAISAFSLDFKEPELKGISKTIWILIKPQLEANNKRYFNGTKPKKKSKTEAKQKQTISKTEANKNVNVNKNKNKHLSFGHLSITKDEHSKLLGDYKESEIQDVYEAIQNYSKNKTYSSLYLTAKNWLKKRHPKVEEITETPEERKARKQEQAKYF